MAASSITLDYGPLGNFDSLHEQQQQLFVVSDLNVSPKWEINFGVGLGPDGGYGSSAGEGDYWTAVFVGEAVAGGVASGDWASENLRDKK